MGDQVTPEEKKDCENAPTSNNIITKCIYKDGENKCLVEPKVCLEITFGGNNDICGKASVSDNSKKCVSKGYSGKCEEAVKSENKEKEDNASNKLNYFFSIISLLYFI